MSGPGDWVEAAIEEDYRRANPDAAEWRRRAEAAEAEARDLRRLVLDQTDRFLRLGESLARAESVVSAARRVLAECPWHGVSIFELISAVENFDKWRDS